MTRSEKKRTPREVIDRIRTHNFLLDIDMASEMVKEGALNLQTQLNNALKLLSDDLYSKKSHFVLELVQNADDNHYAPGITPHLMLEVTPSCFVVVNNEVGFTEDNVKAICSVGASSKSKKNSGYIGEKGIGFKSVFTVSNAPEIHSNGFHFRFDRTVEGNLLGYVVPHWCEPPTNIQHEYTTIVLPASKNYEFGADTLIDVDACLLLFLNKLRQLTLMHDGQRVSYRREDKGELSSLSTISESIGNERLSTERRYVRAEMAFSMQETFTDEKRPGIERSAVVLAFPVDTTGGAKPDPTSHVFAFLPIRQMGFKFAIQADFILNSSREEVLTDRPWNQLLRSGIAEVFSNAVEIFKKHEPLALSYLKYIPAEEEIVDPFFRTLRKSIIDKLAAVNCLRSASGDWRKPTDLRIADKSFRTLFPSNTVKELFGFDYVDSRILGGNDLLRSLGTTDAGLSEVVSVFNAHAKWLQKQPIEWRAKFYAYIADNQPSLVAMGLLNCACLPISDGSCVVPAQSNVFFPLSRGRKYGFESELVLVDNDLYEEAQKHSERVVEFFSAMKVRPDEPYELVNSHILPRHKGDAWKTSNFKALVGHLRYVKDKLNDYLDSALAIGKSEAQAFQLLRDGIWIGTKNQADGTWRFNRVGELYLSKEYKPLFCIESLLGEALDATKLVSPDYLASKPKNPDTDAESWRQFFTQLGIRIAPAGEAEGSNWKCSKELQLLLDSPTTAVRKATIECMSRNWSDYAGHLTFTIQSGRTYISKDTKFALSLRAMQAPTKKRQTVPLAASYYSTTELRTILGDSLPYVDAILTEAMLDACNVTHRLDAKALVKRLKQLKAEDGGTTKQVQGIYRVIDERLWDSDAAYFKQAFSEEGLIQIKGVHRGWFKPSEVAWRSNGAFLDSLYPPLHSLYRDFSKFFCDKLGIPKDLPTQKLVEALTKIDTVENADERKREALIIYRRANRDLTPKFGRETQVPDWIETFQNEAVYINQLGEAVHNDEYLFANDAPSIAALFEDEENISILAAPSVDVPRLNRLLDAAEVRLLSGSITFEVSNAEAGIVNEDLTARVRRSVNSFARVLYAKRPEAFEQALSQGKFASLSAFVVAEVARVDILVCLNDYRRATTAPIALSNGRVLYQTGTKSVKDRLAAELSAFLGKSTDFADTFARILMESEADSIEEFLNVRHIGALPGDLMEALDNADGATTIEKDELDDNDRGSIEQSAGGEKTTFENSHGIADEDEQVASDDERLNEEGLGALLPHANHLESSGGPGAVSEGQFVPTPNQNAGSVGTPMSAPRAPTRQRDAISPTPFDAPISPASPAPAGTQISPSTGPLAGVFNSGKVNPEASHLPTQDSSRTVPVGQLGDVGGYQPRKAFSPGQFRSGQRQRPRTKKGRLLSYAAGPNEAGQTNQAEDPEKIAARDATSRAAVAYFMTTQAWRWRSLIEMPHNNPGFDVHATSHDGYEEFIEVKGQSGAWTEEGVALTPTELMTAQQKRDRYWLCVVEYAQDDMRRQLYLLRNPFGLTNQFRFDMGWKSAAESVAAVPLKPEKDMYVDMPGVGCGRIVSVRGKGQFFNLHVILRDGRQVNKPFNPARMTLSRDPTWQE